MPRAARRRRIVRDVSIISTIFRGSDRAGRLIGAPSVRREFARGNPRADLSAAKDPRRRIHHGGTSARQLYPVQPLLENLIT